ncbi:MAG: hypothetical protein LBE02_06540 [Spirochaetaceae bacterium]|jgi:hypothetical protein|nr:hypothetical protein [Spirochaetaceae bacterium]
MNKLRGAPVVTGFLLLMLGSCAALGLGPSARGWPAPEKKLGAAEIQNIRVDKNADWDSVEAEVRRILPLLLAERGYDRGPQYRVDAVIIEREYTENWKTRRSLSVEIRIWENSGAPENSGPLHGIGEDPLPLAAGTALFSGNRSFSSSRILHRLLRLALSKALEELQKK